MISLLLVSCEKVVQFRVDDGPNGDNELSNDGILSHGGKEVVDDIFVATNGEEEMGFGSEERVGRSNNEGFNCTLEGTTVDGDGALITGTLVNGTLVNGTLVDGTLTIGTLVDGTLVDGTLIIGTLVDGTLVDGTLIIGTLVDGGILVDGTLYQKYYEYEHYKDKMRAEERDEEEKGGIGDERLRSCLRIIYWLIK